MTENIPPFPQIELTPEEQARYDRNVTSFLCDAVAEYSSQSGHTNEDAWIHVRRRKQLSIYKSVYGTRDPQVTLFKGTGLIHGPVQDVMDGLYCDTTDDLRACKTLLKYKLVDGSIMNVTERRSTDAPYRFAGIKWFAAKAAWGLSKHRDVLAYERMGTTTDANGNELAYHVLHSIDHPDWPIDAIKGIKREHQVTCFLYRNHDDTHVECFIWSTVYNLDSVAQRLAEYVVAGTLLNVTDCVKSARAKKYSMLMKHAQHNKWPASSLCHICYGRSFISTNRPCAGCFQSVCKSCSDYRFIFHIDAKTGRPHQQRFCKLCINNTVIIDSLNFEASIKKAINERGETDTEVERVALRGPRTVSNRQNALKSPAKASQSVADTSLRSNYLDWASDWSSQDDDDDEYLRERAATRDRAKSKSNRSDNVSLSDLDAEDKFSPYPATPQSHKKQTEGRNKRVQENRVHQKRRASAFQQPKERYQSPLDQYAAPRKQNHEPRYTNVQGYPAPLPPFRSPYQSSEPKTPSSTRSFTVMSSDSDDGAEVAALPLGESGLGLSQFDLGVVEAAPVAEFDNLDLSMYSDDGGRPQSRRAPRYGRTSHADKDGFLSDLYSLSRSRIHGEHY
ncbi:hypothetical protein PPTG_11854 [Phytophthora nicotianae INRA-310]|uniref:FYVE-type domain-containing protein n=1 Tax=Phytophthora nicotianae (strain INRA-310) TaxID=761204 RepID=W2QA97_PHYN3|nr:hypothetical protein PPTG_11854 [Phytophthora nicotianae INRA-310]ETN09464.1 hypothetical protein PPTG_11854 [Phytophthora nicotianae INRA-310]